MESKARCSACEVVEPLPRSSGRLYLAPPVPHTRRKLREASKALGLSIEEMDGGIQGIALGDGDLSRLLGQLEERLSEPEQKQSHALFVAGNKTPGLGDLLQARSLSVLLGRESGCWLVDLMESDRLFAHFHPIVSMANPANIHAHECLLRARGDDGKTIPPFEIFQAASRAELTFHLDRAARLTAIRDAVSHDLPGKIFINFNPTAIYDPNFCLQTTVRAIHDAGIEPSRLVFEVIESEEISDSKHLKSILQFYRDAGFGVALDDLGAGYASLNLLSSLRPNYIKFDRELVSGIDGDRYRQTVFSKLVEMARELDVKTVAEGVETRSEWDFLASQGVDFAQGFLLCRPDAPPQTPKLPSGAGV